MERSDMGEMRGAAPQSALTFPIASQWAPVLSREQERTLGLAQLYAVPNFNSLIASKFCTPPPTRFTV